MEAIDATITASNFEPVLGPMLRPGAFLLNLAPSVCSRDLIALAQARGAFYVDAGIEPWDYEGGQHTSHLSNYALREEMLAFARCRDTQTTALVAHGTNPGLVSVLVKAALMELAGNAGLRQPEPADRAGWAALARALDVRVIQVAEYEPAGVGLSARRQVRQPWSAEGFITECLQDAELGWAATSARCRTAAIATTTAAARRLRWTGPGVARACDRGPRCRGPSMRT